MLADLSFADLVLWVPLRPPTAGMAVAHVRPTTGPIVFFDDLVGRRIGPGRRPLLDQAFAERPHRPRAASRSGATTCRSARRRSPSSATGGSSAVIDPPHQPGDAAHAEPAGADLPRDGRRPVPDDRRRATSRTAGAPTGPRRGAPRVGDGVIRLSARRDGHLRQPQRDLGVPPAGPRRRRGRRLSWPRSSPTCCATSRPVDESAAARGDRPRAVAHRRGRRAARPSSMRAIPLTEARTAHRRASCCCATSASCAGASASC